MCSGVSRKRKVYQEWLQERSGHSVVVAGVMAGACLTLRSVLQRLKPRWVWSWCLLALALQSLCSSMYGKHLQTPPPPPDIRQPIIPDPFECWFKSFGVWDVRFPTSHALVCFNMRLKRSIRLELCMCKTFQTTHCLLERALDSGVSLQELSWYWLFVCRSRHDVWEYLQEHTWHIGIMCGSAYDNFE